MLTEQKIHSEHDQLHLTLRGRYLATLLAFYCYNPAYLLKTLDLLMSRGGAPTGLVRIISALKQLPQITILVVIEGNNYTVK